MEKLDVGHRSRGRLPAVEPCGGLQVRNSFAEDDVLCEARAADSRDEEQDKQDFSHGDAHLFV